MNFCEEIKQINDRAPYWVTPDFFVGRQNNKIDLVYANYQPNNLCFFLNRVY